MDTQLQTTISTELINGYTHGLNDMELHKVGVSLENEGVTKVILGAIIRGEAYAKQYYTILEDGSYALTVNGEIKTTSYRKVADYFGIGYDTVARYLKVYASKHLLLKMKTEELDGVSSLRGLMKLLEPEKVKAIKTEVKVTTKAMHYGNLRHNGILEFTKQLRYSPVLTMDEELQGKARYQVKVLHTDEVNKVKATIRTKMLRYKRFQGNVGIADTDYNSILRYLKQDTEASHILLDTALSSHPNELIQELGVALQDMLQAHTEEYNQMVADRTDADIALMGTLKIGKKKQYIYLTEYESVATLDGADDEEVLEHYMETTGLGLTADSIASLLGAVDRRKLDDAGKDTYSQLRTKKLELSKADVVADIEYAIEVYIEGLEA